MLFNFFFIFQVFLTNLNRSLDRIKRFYFCAHTLTNILLLIHFNSSQKFNFYCFVFLTQQLYSHVYISMFFFLLMYRILNISIVKLYTYLMDKIDGLFFLIFSFLFVCIKHEQKFHERRINFFSLVNDGDICFITTFMNLLLFVTYTQHRTK